MLRALKSIAEIISFFVIFILCGSLSLFIYYAILGSSTGVYQNANLFYDIRISLLLSFSFVIISGYVITVSITYYLYGRHRGWGFRAPVNSALVIVHSIIFYFFVGTSFSRDDALLVAFGVLSAVVAEFAVSFLWKLDGRGREGVGPRGL